MRDRRRLEDDHCYTVVKGVDRVQQPVGREAIRAYHSGFGWSRAADPSLSPAARGFEREMLFWDYNARRLDGTAAERRHIRRSRSLHLAHARGNGSRRVGVTLTSLRR